MRALGLGRLDDASLKEIPRAQRRPPPLAHYAQRHASRNAAMVAAYGSGGYSLAQFARFFGVHYSTVSSSGAASKATETPDKLRA